MPTVRRTRTRRRSWELSQEKDNLIIFFVSWTYGQAFFDFSCYAALWAFGQLGVPPGKDRRRGLGIEGLLSACIAYVSYS